MKTPEVKKPETPRGYLGKTRFYTVCFNEASNRGIISWDKNSNTCHFLSKPKIQQISYHAKETNGVSIDYALHHQICEWLKLPGETIPEVREFHIVDYDDHGNPF